MYFIYKSINFEFKKAILHLILKSTSSFKTQSKILRFSCDFNEIELQKNFCGGTITKSNTNIFADVINQRTIIGIDITDVSSISNFSIMFQMLHRVSIKNLYLQKNTALKTSISEESAYDQAPCLIPWSASEYYFCQNKRCLPNDSISTQETYCQIGWSQWKFRMWEKKLKRSNRSKINFCCTTDKKKNLFCLVLIFLSFCTQISHI